MANDATGPGAQQRRLASELRSLRSDAGLTRQQVMEQTTINDVTLYRIEKGHTRPQARTLSILLDLYGATSERRAKLDELVASTRSPGWLRPIRPTTSDGIATEYASFEAEARAAHNYETILVPGLLQTQMYSQEIFRLGPRSYSEARIKVLAQARVDRQAALIDRDPRLELWAIIDEAVLRRQVGGPEVMNEQVKHLLEITTLPNVTLQVIPFEKGAHPGMPGAFMRLDFNDPAEPSLVYFDNDASEVFIESDGQVQYFARVFDHLRAIALSPNESMAFISALSSRTAGRSHSTPL